MEQSHDPQPAPQDAILKSALQVGAVTGLSGVVFGGFAGLIRSTTPALFAAASGLQWFALGSSYWGARGLILHMRGGQTASPRERIYASGIAGGIAGAGVAFATRGRSNVIPGAIMISIFASLGQGVFNAADARHARSSYSSQNNSHSEKGFWQRIANAKWSPVQVLSDEDYKKMLQERLLRVEAEIAIIDDEISKLEKADIESRRVD